MERIVAAVFWASLGVVGPSQVLNTALAGVPLNLSSENATLGPEAFPFCGGWVEIYAQVRVGQQERVIVKASPPAGTDWTIRNAHVVVEPVVSAGEPIRFTEAQEFHIKGGEGSLATWSLSSTPTQSMDGLKVALSPFDGCKTDQKIRGVVLKRSFENLTLSR